MKVAELQRLLGNFVPLARAAGASAKVSAEFERALQCLEPFKEKALAEFNDFLRHAEELDRTGKLTAPAGSPKPRTARAPKMSVEEAVRSFNELHTRATDPALTYADIDAKLGLFQKLTVPQLRQVATQVGVTVPAKGKPQII